MTRSAIARPVLTESARLSAEDLVELAQTKGEQHLLAISGRWWLNEVVTDALLTRHYPSVSRRLVTNPGARVSANGYAIVLEQAETDPDLAVETGIRVDLPPELRQQLLRNATEAVRARLLSRAPPHLFEEIRERDRGCVRRRRPRDVADARFRRGAALRRARWQGTASSTKPALLGFARQRKYEETVAALAELSGSSIDVIRPLMQSLRDDGVLIPCRVAGLSWETVSRRARQPLRLGQHGPARTGEGQRANTRKLTLENAAAC